MPNLLLIGDSIMSGYHPTVSRLLENHFDVYRIPSNGRDTAYGLEHIDDWLAAGSWDAIHFNWGLHDQGAQVPLEDYTANLHGLIDAMEATGARLIFADTTPGLADPQCSVATLEVQDYNVAAKAVMAARGIPVTRLNSGAPTFEAVAPCDVHYTQTGSLILGNEVAGHIYSSYFAPEPGFVLSMLVGILALRWMGRWRGCGGLAGIRRRRAQSTQPSRSL